MGLGVERNGRSSLVPWLLEARVSPSFLRAWLRGQGFFQLLPKGEKGGGGGGGGERRGGGGEGGGQGREREKEEEEGTYHEAMESTVVWVNEQGGQCAGLCCAVPAIRAVH